jgi:predicted nucleic acid-binding Zn ribbon protein
MNSDALVNIENEAFDLVERGRADEAMMMLFSDSYHRAKANIMRPIRSLQESMDQQTSEQLEIEIERQRKTDTMIVAMLLGALIFGTISGLWRRPRTEA